MLFVDYIAEHLNPAGRAGVIVPEGIIFQSQNAYKALRKMLIENYLWAVISLPAGIFNPYSGVKTSILLMDKNLAQKTDYILFAKIENDGFDLGAQRREIEGSDLPVILDYLRQYKIGIANDEIIDDIDLAHSVAKDEIAKDGDYNLSGQRYREFEHHAQSEYPMVELGEVCTFKRGPFGGSLKKEIFVKEGYKVYEQKNAIQDNFDIGSYYVTAEKYLEMKDFALMPEDLIVSCSGTMGRIAIVPQNIKPGIINQALLKLSPSKHKVLPIFIKLNLESCAVQHKYFANQSGAAIQNVMSVKVLKKIKIPLPPLEVQERIVAEIEGYQNQIEDYRNKIGDCELKIRGAIDNVWGHKSKDTV